MDVDWGEPAEAREPEPEPETLPAGYGLCPTCGSVLRIETSDEGTSSYAPLDEAVLHEELRTIRTTLKDGNVLNAISLVNHLIKWTGAELEP